MPDPVGRLVRPLLLALALAPLARAHTWNDPWFDEAVRAAALIAEGRVDADDGATATVSLERVFAGSAAEGDVVEVWHGEELRKHAGNGHVKVGAVHLFILRAAEEGAGYRSFTDSYWAFPVKEARYYLSLRDPFAEQWVPSATFAGFVELLRAEVAAPARARAFADPLIDGAAAGDPATTDSAVVEAQLIGLEAAHHFGTEPQAERLVRLFESPYFHVRVSCARGLAGCGGPAAREALLLRLPLEEQPAVQSTVCLALARLGPDAAAPRAPASLVAFVERASRDRVELKRNLMEGKSNTLLAPRIAAIVAVMRLEGEPGTVDELAQRAEAYWSER